MTFCQQSVPHIVLGVRECSQSITQSPVHSLTFQQLHDMLTPAALQRSELDSSAHCPVAPPYSVGSGDGSGWPLRMVLPRRRSTEHHSHPTASAVHLAPSPCFLAAEITGVGQVERAHHRLHTQKNIIHMTLWLPHGTPPLLGRTQSSCGASCLSSCSAKEHLRASVSGMLTEMPQRNTEVQEARALPGRVNKD